MHRNILYNILIVAVLHAFCKCIGNAQDKKYSNIDCDGNGHIEITVTDSITSVVSNCANGGVTNKNTTTEKTVIFDNCPLNQHVKILMSEDIGNSHVNNIIYTKGVGEVIDVVCNGTGLKVNASVDNDPVNFKTVTVAYHEQLTMKCFAKTDMHTEVPSIAVGGDYTLQIKATDNLHIHVQSCEATPGDKTSEKVQLYDYGNFVVGNGVLKTKFEEKTLKTASVDLLGFRFIGKENVVITCTVDVSTPTTTAASPTTTQSRRKRRNAFQQKHKTNLEVSTSLRVESLSTNGVQGMVAKEGRCILMASILLVKYSLHWF